MTTMLISGGAVSEIIKLASQYIDQGDRVVLFHPFPGGTCSKVPAGAEIVFDIDPNGLNPREIANIYGAERVVNLNRSTPRNALPQHLY